MEQLVIHGGIRTSLRKREKNRIRRQGGVPAVLYGRTVASTPIYIDSESFKRIAAHNGYGLVELHIDSLSKHHALIHAIDREPLHGKVLHIDFHAVSLDKPVDVEVPVYLDGLEEVEKNGGVIQQQMREVMVRALTAAVPEQIRVDISNLRVGDILRANDLSVPSGVIVKTAPDEIIATVIEPVNAPPDTEIEPKEPELVHDTEGEGIGAGDHPNAHD